MHHNRISKQLNLVVFSLSLVILVLGACSKEYLPDSKSAISFFFLEGDQLISKSTKLNNGDNILIGSNNGNATINYISKEGSVVWLNAENGIFYDVLETSTGNILAIGSTKGKSVSGYSEGLIVEYSPSGGINWRKEITLDQINEYYSATETKNGEFLLTGRHIIDNTKTLLTKLSNQGDILWTKTYEIGISNSFGRSIVESPTGDYVLAGLCKSLTKSNGYFGYDTYIAFINPNVGDIKDTTIYYSDTTSFSTDIRHPFFSDNPSKLNLVLKNTIDGYVWFTLIPSYRGTSKVQFVKLDFDGNILKKQKYGGLDNIILNNAVNTTDGGYIICAQSSQNLINPELPYYFNQSLATAIKLDKNGNEIWTNYFGDLRLTSSCLNGQVSADEFRMLEASKDKFTNQKKYVYYTLDKDGNAQN